MELRYNLLMVVLWPDAGPQEEFIDRIDKIDYL